MGEHQAIEVGRGPAAQPETRSRIRWFPIGWIPHLLALVLAGALAALVIVNWGRWIGGAGPQWTDDAYVQSDVTPLSALIAGPVSQVAVADFQRVKKDDLLVRIDDRTYAAEVAQTEGNVAAANAAIVNLRAQEQLQLANIAAAEATVQGNLATEHKNQLESIRQHALLASHLAGTEQAVEQADAAYKLSEAQVLQSQAGVEAGGRQLQVQHTQEAQLAANLKAAEAALGIARINLGYTRITAPADGMVGQRRVYPGEYVGIGTQVISLVPLPLVYVIANYKETQLTHLAVGQPAEVRIDTFPGVVLRGRVAAWSPGAGSVFTLLPPDNATGNFTKVVQRIPVKIVLDDHKLGDRLRPGMSVEVTIHTDQPGAHA